MNLRFRCIPSRAASLCVLASLAIALPAFGGRQVPGYRGAQGDVARSGAVRPTADRGLNVYQRARLQTMAASGVAAGEDTLRLLALQVQFSDSLMGGQPGSNRAQVRDSLWFANELRHMEQYFRGASRGRLHIRWTVDGTLHTLPRKMSYYGSDTFEEKRVVELAQTAVDLADGAVDFSGYDHVFIIHAGAGQETDVGGDSPIQIWSSFYDVGDIRRALDDESAPGLATLDSLSGSPFFVNNFCIVPSHASQDFATVGTLGIWAFQIGSRIGLVPMFDSTPRGAPDSQGAGSFCLMAYGLFNVNGFVPGFPGAFNRLIAGWISPVVVDPVAGATSVRLADINTGADADTVCVKVPITESEYYLVVNRVHDANFDSLFTFGDADSNLIPNNTDSLEGAEFDFFLTDLTNPAARRFDPDYGFAVLRRHTGSGVYIWHVDERVVAEAVASGFLPNDFVARKGVDLEEADGVQDLDRLGAAAFSLGSFFDSYRLGDGNAATFGPKTKPASVSNAGVATGITIETLSAPGATMQVRIRRDTPYTEARTRWRAASPSQPATVVDLDGAGDAEVVVLSDDAGVFVFDGQGREWVDGDLDPATIAPFIAVPGVTWTGPPAFADLDGGGDIEIVAIATAGRVYAWKASGAELADGDANPATQGVLFSGGPMVAPPMLVDVDADGVPEIVIAERVGESIRVSFVNASGALTQPSAAETAPLWPLTLPAQRAKAFALSRVTDGTTETTGIVAACVDTVASRSFVAWTPVSFSGAAPAGTPEAWVHVLAAGRTDAPSAPAVGDIDGDGDDEIVVALADGGVFVLDPASAFSQTVRRESGRLRSAGPSDPALGDVDGDGTLEIAIWDAGYMYILKSNARTMLEWPAVIRPEAAGEAPAIAPRRGMESALVADIDGDGGTDVLFPLDDGTLAAVSASGRPAAGFPRTGPSGHGAAPSVARIGSGDWSLVALGSNALFAGLDAINDSLLTDPETTLSIQSLAGTVADPFWVMARADLARTGRASAGTPVRTSASVYDEGSFMIYPNPVKGGEVRARVTTHTSARVHLSIYTVEGQEAVARTFDVNPNGLVNTPFDEAVDVAALKSGVYLLRLKIDGKNGGGSLVKPFAIRR